MVTPILNINTHEVSTTTLEITALGDGDFEITDYVAADITFDIADTPLFGTGTYTIPSGSELGFMADPIVTGSQSVGETRTIGTAFYYSEGVDPTLEIRIDDVLQGTSLPFDYVVGANDGDAGVTADVILTSGSNTATSTVVLVEVTP